MLGLEDRVQVFTPARQLSLTFVFRFSLFVILRTVS